MFDEQPRTPNPIRLAAHLARGNADESELCQAAAWMRDAHDAMRDLFAADHYDHFAARMSDSEMAAIDKMRALLMRAAQPKGDAE